MHNSRTLIPVTTIYILPKDFSLSHKVSHVVQTTPHNKELAEVKIKYPKNAGLRPTVDMEIKIH